MTVRLVSRPATVLFKLTYKLIPEKYKYSPLPKELSIVNRKIVTKESIQDVILEQCYFEPNGVSYIAAGAMRFMRYSREPNCSLVRDEGRYFVSIDSPLPYGEVLTINTPPILDGYNIMADEFIEVKKSEIHGNGLFWKGVGIEFFSHIGSHRLWPGAFVNDCGDMQPNAKIVKRRGFLKIKLDVDTIKSGDEILVDYSKSPCGAW